MNSHPSKENVMSAQLTALGNDQLFQRDYHGAISIYNKAIESYAGSLLALQGRAFCKTLLIDEILPKDHRDHLQELVSDLEKALELARDLVEHLDREPNT